MKGRAVAAAAATMAVWLLSGCVMPGPIHNRLVTSEWRATPRFPIVLREDWEYRGEYWERTVTEAEWRARKHHRRSKARDETPAALAPASDATSPAD
ncbi:MAG: hypothetical protein KatS3mg102_0883 [Planctomycetota bacterium]|nr:MAG: hypothetical protein KatS3mg102_0883 [Planctomycetota bacterium]